MATTADDDGSLEPVERDLVDHVERGEFLDLARGLPVDDAAMRSWDASRTVRAWVIRDIARGRLASSPDPHGLRLRGAMISGRLDLDNVTSTVPITLHDCLLGDGLVARDATLAPLDLKGCRLEHPAQPALDLERLATRVVSLERITATAHNTRGAVILSGARLGYLWCTAANLHNNSGPALKADTLRVDGIAFLRDGFEAIGAGELGAVRLVNAHLGQLECDGASLRNNSGPALDADSLRVDQRMSLRGGFEAVGIGRRGAVRLFGAHVGGQLSCTGARLRNDSGPALVADNLSVEQNVLLCGGFTTIGSDERGAVRLFGAHLGGLDFGGASLSNDNGPALHADGLTVDQDVFLGGGFTAIGAGEDGAVRLVGAHLGGLDCTAASLRNDSGPALHANRARVDQKVFFAGGFAAIGAGNGVVVDLTDLQIGGALKFEPTRLEHRTNPQRRLIVDGLAYTGLPLGVGPDGWLSLVRNGTPGYVAQPYQLLAAAHRAAGHDDQARCVLRLQRHDQIHRKALTGRAERTWARFTGLTLGYGYQPWRALIGFLAVALLAVALAIILGNQDGLAQIRNPPSLAPLGCALVDQIGVGLDLGTPLFTTGARAHCDMTNTTNGRILTATGWLLRLLAWAFATLFIAGFTSAVRKT